MQDIKSVIGQRINRLLATSDKKQKELAIYLGVKDNVISYFVNGVRMPNVEQIIKIAVFFETTTDYILGKSNTPSLDRDRQFVCEYTGLSDEAVEILEFAENNMPFINTYISDFINHSELIELFNTIHVSILFKTLCENDANGSRSHEMETYYFAQRYKLNQMFNLIIDDIVAKGITEAIKSPENADFLEKIRNYGGSDNGNNKKAE